MAAQRGGYPPWRGRSVDREVERGQNALLFRIIYNDPANVFVAEFMGSPSMNMLTVPVEEDAKGLFLTLTRAGGDALRLPLPDASADVATVAFGIRNVADRVEGLREMKRVLRPGGKLIVLEFTQPPGRVFGGLYRFYFTQVLPKLGGVVSGDSDAYSYLPRTVLAWPDPAAFQREFEDVGLEDCGYELLTRGILEAAQRAGRVPGMFHLFPCLRRNRCPAPSIRLPC